MGDAEGQGGEDPRLTIIQQYCLKTMKMVSECYQGGRLNHHPFFSVMDLVVSWRGYSMAILRILGPKFHYLETSISRMAHYMDQKYYYIEK